MSKSRARGGWMRGRGDVMEMWQAPKQSLPAQIIGIMLRWRVELACLAVLIVAIVWAKIHIANPTVQLLTLLVPVAALLALPWTRRFVLSRFWCVMDRHRLRTCLRMARYRTMNLDGALPLMLWARPTKTGERVWMWTRAGSSADDIEPVLGYVASACYAREARLHRSKWVATLVAVEVVRRDPLRKRSMISSPLSPLATGDTTAEGVEPISAAATVTPTAQVPQQRATDHAPAQASTGRAHRKTASSSRNGSVSASDAVLVGGEDVSDYID